jgi:hypothetical protein
MCSFCGSPLPQGRPIGFGETCEACGKDLHSCSNCAFHAFDRRWECSETIDSPVSDKEKRNFCDWFQGNPVLSKMTEGRRSERDAAAKARDDVNKLFGI